MKLARADEVQVCKQKIAADIRNQLRQAKNVIEDLLGGTDEYLYERLPTLQAKMSDVDRLTLTYEEYTEEAKDIEERGREK
jgi:hypothetical protein